jgi:PTH1 family peptidyl-tRNA hydrolase
MRESRLKLIVGLGNPGLEYVNTRHNMGFEVIDELCAGFRCQDIQERCRSEVAKVRYASKNFFLQKPLTFMNLSGEAVKGLCRQEKIKPEEVLVIYDCLDLPIGTMRIKKSGSSGGQKGMESIIQHFETEKIARIRIGIGDSQEDKVSDYVLGRFSQIERKVINQVIKHASEASKMVIRFGIDRAMNKFNALNANLVECSKEI